MKSSQTGITLCSLWLLDLDHGCWLAYSTGMGGMVWFYTVLMNIRFYTVGAFCFGFFRFCLYAGNILSWYPLFAQTLPGLCSLVFILVWVQCSYLAAVSIELNLFLFWAVQCVLQQTKFQRWRKTGHKGKSPNWENAMKSHMWSHKVNLKAQNFRLLAN